MAFSFKVNGKEVKNPIARFAAAAILILLVAAAALVIGPIALAFGLVLFVLYLLLLPFI